METTCKLPHEVPQSLPENVSLLIFDLFTPVAGTVEETDSAGASGAGLWLQDSTAVCQAFPCLCRHKTRDLAMAAIKAWAVLLVPIYLFHGVDVPPTCLQNMSNKISQCT